VPNYSAQRSEFLIIGLNSAPNKFCSKKNGKKRGKGGKSEKVILPARHMEKHCTYFSPAVVVFPNLTD